MQLDRVMSKRMFYFVAFLSGWITMAGTVRAQTIRDTVPSVNNKIDSLEKLLATSDSTLRIKNLNPYFNVHVDSTLTYKFDINKDSSKYFWFLKNSPVGLRINKDNGILTFRAEKSFFLSGRLKYDYEYKVNIGVQNLNNPKDRIDTSFTLVFYNTEIIPSHIKPSIASSLFADEGDTISFKLQCDEGSFPIDNISFITNTPIKNFTNVTKCGDEFVWGIPFDFVKETDSAKQKVLLLSFIGTNKFYNKDTATVKIIVRDALNYPQRVSEYQTLRHDINYYILQLKYTFKVLDGRVKATGRTRSTFDLTSATSALGGTVISSLPNGSDQSAGKILPGVGVALVPVKEAVAPPKTTEQNAATTLRGNIKRLEYSLRENSIIGEQDADINNKIKKMREDLKQVQLLLIDVPLEIAESLNEEDLNKYFNSPKVNKKYRTKK